jgi:hypothetical protein
VSFPRERRRWYRLSSPADEVAAEVRRAETRFAGMRGRERDGPGRQPVAEGVGTNGPRGHGPGPPPLSQVIGAAALDQQYLVPSTLFIGW